MYVIRTVSRRRELEQISAGIVLRLAVGEWGSARLGKKTDQSTVTTHCTPKLRGSRARKGKGKQINRYYHHLFVSDKHQFDSILSPSLSRARVRISSHHSTHQASHAAHVISSPCRIDTCQPSTPHSSSVSVTSYRTPYPLHKRSRAMIAAASPRAGSRLLLPIRQAVRCRRSFHAHDHPPPPGPFGATESAILAAAYRHVPEHGFTQRALSLGARDVGLLDISSSALVDGPFSLIRWHLITQRQALAWRSRELFEGENAPLLGVGRKVAALTWERLLGNKDVIHRWQEVCTNAGAPLNK